MSNDTEGCFPNCFTVDRLVSSEWHSLLPTLGGSGVFEFTIQVDHAPNERALVTSEVSEPDGIILDDTVNLLPDARLSIKVPIEVKIEREEDSWICSWEAVRLFATGDSAADAKLSFVEYLCDDFNYWNQLPLEQLSEDSKKLLATYHKHIESLTL